uniref:Uncharacterized protein n=1 Tax=Salvator merianae TaxID=96440 RepID=A0A8D0C534_SALMN
MVSGAQLQVGRAGGRREMPGAGRAPRARARAGGRPNAASTGGACGRGGGDGLVPVAARLPGAGRPSAAAAPRLSLVPSRQLRRHRLRLRRRRSSAGLRAPRVPHGVLLRLPAALAPRRPLRAILAAMRPAAATEGGGAPGEAAAERGGRCPSPSGCTFWGKKPWSRRRKVLWQLAMVLGAPMAIALAAGVAVPVITLGIPIYTGKKVLSHGRKRRRSACQQCLSLAGSCLLSLLVSPVITAVTVVNDLLAVLPTSPLAAEGDRVATASLPSRRQGQQKEPCQGQQDSRSTGAVARAGSASGKAREAADRQEPNAVEVEVEAEAAQEQSLCHASPGPGISAASLTGTSAAACSLAGVTAE